MLNVKKYERQGKENQIICRQIHHRLFIPKLCLYA